MIIIGVTGNTGAGKSTVSTIIKNNTGASIIDADRISKELMVPGEKYYDQVIELFGNDIINNKKNGKINTSKLAKIIYNDDEKREKLNKITFKYVGKQTKKIIMENKDKDVIVLDFPLLYEGGFDKICNCVIGVVADDDTKISRIRVRDKVNKEQAIERLNSQMNEDELKKNVDYIVDNSKETRYISLVKNVVRLVHKIKKDEEEKKKA